MKLFNLIATSVLGAAMAIGVGVAITNHKDSKMVNAANQTASVSISERAGTLGWNNGVAYSGWTDTSGKFAFTAGGGGNNGKYYTSDNSWRMYNGGTLTISCADSINIVSVASTPTSAFTVAANKHSASVSLTATVKYTAFTVTYAEGAADLPMKIVDSTDNEGPYNMSYGDASGSFFYAKSDSTIQTSGITWTVSDSDILVLDSDFADNHCWVKPGTKIGSATLRATKDGYSTAEATITVAKGDLDSIAVSGSMTTTGYAKDSVWDPSGLVVTATYSTGYTADVTASATWTYSPATPNATSVTSVVATASYTENAITKQANSAAQAVTVFEGATYDLSQIDGFSSWTNSYGVHEVASTSITGASAAATLSFQITNKQTSGIGSEYPCIGTRTSTELECLRFTLTEANKKISTVSITFVTRYTSTYPSLYLHKGSGIASAAIADLTMSGSSGKELQLTYGNLNETVFTVGYNANQTDSNGAVGIKSITLGLEEAGAYGTTHHIKVTSYPKTIYHVGELYDSTGLAVTAYDGADEATANFKDVTASITTGFVSGIRRFDDSDVPTVNMWIEYLDESSTVRSTSIDMTIYSLAQYELVTTDLDDWSGNYLIVATNGDSDLVAMDGSLANPDAENGYKVVEDNANIIETGQELEWTIAKVTGGYSIVGKSGKYIGSLTGKSNGMLVSETALVNTLAHDGSGVAISGTNDYHLTFNTDGDRFRYYSSGNVKLYKLVESDNADEFAQKFLAAFTCNASGTSKPTFNLKEGETYWTWALLAAEYDTLTAAEKEQFRLGSPSESGTNIQKAIARYDYVVGKYFKTGVDTSFTDFMNRDPAAPSRVTSPISIANNSVVVIVIVSSFVVIASTAAFFILRKKRFSK